MATSFTTMNFSSPMIDFSNFVYRKYPAKLLIPVVDAPTSPERKCNIHVYDTALQPINHRDIILTSLVLVHAGYLLCNWNPLNASYHWTTFDGIPGSFNSSQINVCIMRIGVLEPRFIVFSERLGLHKLLPSRGFKPSTSQASAVPLGHSSPVCQYTIRPFVNNLFFIHKKNSVCTRAKYTFQNV